VQWRFGDDEAGIQFVFCIHPQARSTRHTAQADRILYQAAIRATTENHHSVVVPAAIDDFIVDGERVIGAVHQFGIKFSVNKKKKNTCRCIDCWYFPLQIQCRLE